MKQMDLAEALYCIVMCAIMLFFGFAAAAANQGEDHNQSQ